MENEEMEETEDTQASRPDEALERRWHAEEFRARLERRLRGDEIAVAVLGCMIEGETAVSDQATSTGFSAVQVRDARRRIFHHAEKVTVELSRELDEEEVAE